MSMSKYDRVPRMKGKARNYVSLPASVSIDKIAASNAWPASSICSWRNRKYEVRGMVDYSKFVIHNPPTRIPVWLADYRKRNGIKLPEQYTTEV